VANSKNLVFCGIVLSLLSASSIPASADVCGDFHANVAKLSEDLDQQKAEMARVSSMQPSPPTDAALCTALQKVHDDAEAFIFHVDEECFPGTQELASFNDDVKTVYHDASEGIGLFHCSR
jgi:hypothetical protein